MSAFAVPSDPDTRKAWLLVVGSVGLLLLFGRLFHDVQPV